MKKAFRSGTVVQYSRIEQKQTFAAFMITTRISVEAYERYMKKPTKWHPPSLIRVFAVRMKKAWVLSYQMSAQRRLIRLDGCPGWYESSLGAQSFCLFCLDVAHINFHFMHVVRLCSWLMICTFIVFQNTSNLAHYFQICCNWLTYYRSFLLDIC